MPRAACVQEERSSWCVTGAILQHFRTGYLPRTTFLAHQSTLSTGRDSRKSCSLLLEPAHRPFPPVSMESSSEQRGCPIQKPAKSAPGECLHYAGSAGGNRVHERFICYDRRSCRAPDTHTQAHKYTQVLRRINLRLLVYNSIL